MEINLFDGLFDHSKNEDGFYTCSMGREPQEVTWVRRNMVWGGVTVFTDSHFMSPIVDEVVSKYKIAWLLESKAITPNAYNDIVRFEDKFDFILTHDETLLNRSDKYVKCIVGASRVPDSEWGTPLKTKLLSMIASNKRMSDGHRFRHEISNTLGEKHNIDMWGSGYKRFDSKVTPLKDYAYSVCVINTKVNNYFTEILVDPISLGCVPILWGCPNIGEYFNPNGIITFNTINELDDILHNISFDDYNSRIEAVKENIEKAKEMKSTDDYISRIIKKITN
tara:strand:- start:27 stop:866 length:840 start_codon:yes stop_codon:yes gene_type:complete